MKQKQRSGNNLQKKNQWIILAVILVIAAIIYGRTSGFGFMDGWDDMEYIEAKDVRALDIKAIFTGFHLGMYQPLSVLTLSLNFQASGESATGYHATNVLLHLLNIILVYFVWIKFTENRELAALVAFIFAVHPMNAEAVAWVSARSTLLFTLFSLLSLLFYLKYRQENGKIKLYLATLAFFILAALSKSMAMTLPLIFILIDWYLKEKPSWKIFLDKIPFLLISVATGLITIEASRSFGHISSIDQDFTFADRIIINIHAFVLYIFKALIPVNLSAIYAFPSLNNGHLSSLYYLSVIPILFIIIICFWKSALRKEYIFGFLFFLISISVVLPLIWTRKFMAGERYAYFSYLGLYFIMAHIFLYLTRFKRLSRIKNYTGVAGLIFLIFLISTTYQRITLWKNTELLLGDVIKKDRTGRASAQAYYYMGSLDFDRQNYQEALEAFNNAIALMPAFAEAYNDRGILKGMAGRYQDALNDFSRAIEYDPDNAESYYNRGFAWMQTGNSEMACKDWKKALDMDFPEARKALIRYCNQ